MKKTRKPPKPHTLLDGITPEVLDIQARQILVGEALTALSREVEEYRKVIAHQIRQHRRAA